MDSLLRVRDVMQRTGFARSTIYGHAQQGLFPPPVKIGMNIACWPASEIAQVMQARIAGKPENEIRELVARIVRERVGLTGGRAA